MRKFLFKSVCLIIAALAILAVFRGNAGLLGGEAVMGLDDGSGWLTSHSEDTRPFDILESLGSSMLRVEMPWNEVELSPGAFTWSYQSDTGYVNYAQLFNRLEKRGIHPVIVLSGGPMYLSHLYPQQPVNRESMLENWNSFISEVVQQFGGQVDHWQIGSDLNSSAAWGKVLFPSDPQSESMPDVQLYAEMLKSAYSIIKSASAGDIIILGDLALGGDCADHPLFFLQNLADLDAWYAFDVISLSLPTLEDAPESVQMDICGFLPLQSSGYALPDAVKTIRDFSEETGTKSVWVHHLAFSEALLAEKALERQTLPQVVESDYLVRASGLLMAYGGVEKLFWAYQPQIEKPSDIALQSFANLAQSLNPQPESNATNGSPDFEILRFQRDGHLNLLTWHMQGGDEALPLIVSQVAGYQLHAFSMDAESLKTSNGIKLKVDDGGASALLVSERPVLISGRPSDLKRYFTIAFQDQAAKTSRVLKASLTSWLQAQKLRTVDKLGRWVDEQQTSLLDMLKTGFQQWLRKSLGLARK